MSDTISIIIPIYNQEKFLEKCLSSIEKQKYTDFEVLMIDDGSVDLSSEICKLFQDRDSRFMYFQQENAGVAAARNTGLSKVTGKYISFIDPDDYVSEKFLSVLIESLKSHSCDIAVVKHIEVASYQGEWEENHSNIEEGSFLCTKEKALKMLCENTEVKSHLWNKLYKKELFENIQFENGRVYEDLHILHKIFARAHRFVFSNSMLYYYRQYSGSIVGTHTLRKQLDCCYAYKCRYDDLATLYPDTKKDILRNYTYEILELLNLTIKCEKNEWTHFKDEIQISIKQYLDLSESNSGIRIKLKIFLLYPTLTRFFYKLRCAYKKNNR